MSAVKIDHQSLLVEVAAETPLGACEEALAAAGLTLAITGMDRGLAVGAWLAEGAPGARDPWADPADHLVAGLEATTVGGKRLSIRPGPRRAVGPDLIALVVGMRGRFATLHSAWLRVHSTDAPPARPHPLHADRNPAITEEEEGLLSTLERALR